MMIKKDLIELVKYMIYKSIAEDFKNKSFDIDRTEKNKKKKSNNK